MKPPTDHYERPDASPARMKAFRANIGKAKAAWFDSRFGDHQISLLTLATLPEYQRRGAGRMLCEWGLAMAKEEGVAVTLFSSPIAQRLYAKLGFKEVGTVHVQVEGEKEFIEFSAMIWEREKKKKSEGKGLT